MTGFRRGTVEKCGKRGKPKFEFETVGYGLMVNVVQIIQQPSNQVNQERKLVAIRVGSFGVSEPRGSLPFPDGPHRRPILVHFLSRKNLTRATVND